MKWISGGGKRYFLLAVLVLLLIAGGIAWMERDALLLWYYFRNLREAEPQQAQKWAQRVASLEQQAIPDLIECLKTDDPRICSNASCALCCMVERWSWEDPRSRSCLYRFTKSFPYLSRKGQMALLEAVLRWTDPMPKESTALCETLGRLLPEISGQPEEPLLGMATKLTHRLVQASQKGGLLAAARELALCALKSSELETRSLAVDLAMLPGMHLRKDVVPLLDDPEAIVRLKALKAVAFPIQEQPEVILTHHLIQWLHDSDYDVRKACERALLRRKLSRSQIHLARQITHPQWETRIQVIEQLPRHHDLDPSVWLRRLTHDSAAAVRVAAIRAASEMAQVDLRDRMDQMARNDPDETVRAQALYYLSQSSQKLP